MTLILLSHPDNVAIQLFPGPGIKCLREAADRMVGLQRSEGSLAGL